MIERQKLLRSDLPVSIVLHMMPCRGHYAEPDTITVSIHASSDTVLRFFHLIQKAIRCIQLLIPQ